MQPIKLPNAGAHIITVSTTAGSLESFIETAASANVDLSNADSVDLIARTNGFTYLNDGNTPTATNGFQVSEGGNVSLRGLNLNNVQLIRTGGTDATVEVGVGQTNPK